MIEKNDNILNDEIIETKQIKKGYKPRDTNYNTYYYRTTVAPIECNSCGCIAVNRALYKHKKTAKCKLVKHANDISQTGYNKNKLIQYIMTS